MTQQTPRSSPHAKLRLFAAAPAGDLLAALLLARMHRHPRDLATAVEQAVAGLQGVLRATALQCPSSLLSSRERSSEVRGGLESIGVIWSETLHRSALGLRSGGLQTEYDGSP